MRRTVLWVAAALALIAVPAVIGLVALRGDDGNSSASRRAAALVAVGAKSGAGYQLTITNLTPAGQAIEGVSYAWGVRNPSSAMGSGTTTGRAQFSDLVVTKKLDEVSPLLVKGATLGTTYPSAVLTLFKSAGGGPVEYATYTLTNAVIASVQHSGSSADIPMEEVTIAYSAIKTEISSVDDSGRPSAPGVFSFNIAAAKVG